MIFSAFNKLLDWKRAASDKPNIVARENRQNATKTPKIIDELFTNMPLLSYYYFFLVIHVEVNMRENGILTPTA